MAAVNPIPAGHQQLITSIVVKGALEAIDFYKRAFGAVLLGEPAMTPGTNTVMHAELRIGDTVLMLNDEMPDWGIFGPDPTKKQASSFYLYVPNVDDVYARAVAAGGTPTEPVQDMFWGDRCGGINDPYGHHWLIATHTAT